jgi:hypothetical protein
MGNVIEVPSPTESGLVERFLDGAEVFGRDWIGLPTWARYLVHMGANAATQPLRTCALVLPTRAYAAMFCAIGVVLRRLSVPVPRDAATHFARLRELPPRTDVTYRTRALGRIPGWLVGCETIAGDEYLVVQPSRGATIRVGRPYALEVMPSDKVMAKLPGHPAYRASRRRGPLLTALLPASLAWEAMVSSRLECVVVGSESTLQDEFTSTRLRFPAGSSTEGSAQEVIRVQHFGCGVEDRSYRSDVFSRTGSRQEKARTVTPSVTIFDGASSLLRWGSLWPTASRIVLLDRTDHRLSDATDEVDRVFFQQRAQQDLGEVPAGVDAVVFERGA